MLLNAKKCFLFRSEHKVLCSKPSAATTFYSPCSSDINFILKRSMFVRLTYIRWYTPEIYLCSDFFSNKWHQYLHEGWEWKSLSLVQVNKHPHHQTQIRGYKHTPQHPHLLLRLIQSTSKHNLLMCISAAKEYSTKVMLFYCWGLIYSKWSRSMHYSACWDKYLVSVFMQSFFSENSVILFPHNVHWKSPVISKHVIIHQ